MEIEFFVESLSVLWVLSAGEYTSVCYLNIADRFFNFSGQRVAAGILIDVTDKELIFKKGWSVYMMLTNSIPTPLNDFSV